MKVPSVGVGHAAQVVRALARAAAQRLAPARRLVSRYAVPAWATITPTGRAVLSLSVAAWVLSWRFGWEEMAVVAGVGLVLMVGSAFFMIGRTNLAVRMDVNPPRVTVGESVTGSIEVTNRSRSPLLPVLMELPVGVGGIGFDVPALRSGSSHSELFVVPTEHRGVIPVGPATSVRGDAVGLFRRDQAWTAVTEIFVHPTVTPLEPLAAGLIRDLEGNTSENVSMSDLAFHALREYIPGDDLRHVHWRSTARHGTLLVRQFLDTRRSHINVVVDCRPEVYRSEEDFEVAVSVAGSVLVRAILDEYDATFVCGPHAMTRGSGRSALDACSRAELGPSSLINVAGHSARLAPDTSVAFFITGSAIEFTALRRAAAQFPIEVSKVAICVDTEARPGLRNVADIPMLTLSKLDELPGLLRWGL